MSVFQILLPFFRSCQTNSLHRFYSERLYDGFELHGKVVEHAPERPEGMDAKVQPTAMVADDLYYRYGRY